MCVFCLCSFHYWLLGPQSRVTSCSSFSICVVSLSNLGSNVTVHPMQGRFFLCVMVAMGMHSSIIDMNFCTQPSHTVSMQDTSLRNDQSIASINLLALSKSAWGYLQIVRLLAFTRQGLQNHFKVTDIPLWSEFSSGGITLQFTNCDGTDSNTRSIKEMYHWGWSGYTAKRDVTLTMIFFTRVATVDMVLWE